MSNTYASPYQSPYKSAHQSPYLPANGFEPIAAVMIGDSYMEPDQVGGPTGYYTWPNYSTSISTAQHDNTSCQAGKRLIGGTLPVVDNIATILSTHNAGTVCLQIGSNDIINGTSLNDLQRAMMDVINAIVADGRKIIIGGVAPIGAYVDVVADEVVINTAYGEWLRAICSEYGFEYVDYYEYLEGSTPDEYDPAKHHESLEDFLHPNEESARYMASKWDRAIQNSVNRPLVTSVPTYYQQMFTTAVDSKLGGALIPTGHASTGRYTFSIWVEPDAVASVQRLFNISFFSTDLVDTQITAAAVGRAFDNYGVAAITGAPSPGTLSAGQRYHFIMSAAHNGNDAQFYINGEKIGEDLSLSAMNAAAGAYDWAFLGKAGVSAGLAGKFSDIFYDDEFFDLDDEPTLRKFILADGSPADIFGTDGTDGTIGYAPIFYFGTRSTLTQLNAGTNIGDSAVQDLTKSGTAFALAF